MAVAGLLAQYLAIKNQLSEYELQLTRWNDLSTAMSKKVSEQENQQTKWDSESGKIIDSYNNESATVTYRGETYLQKGKGVGKFAKSDSVHIAEAYAHARVPKFDEDKLEEYTALDIEYSTMSSMYETLVSELEAQRDGLKDQLGKDAQDTHLLQ